MTSTIVTADIKWEEWLNKLLELIHWLVSAVFDYTYTRVINLKQMIWLTI